MPKSLYTKTYGERRRQAASAAIARARTTILTNRRYTAPLRTGGQYGPSIRRRLGELNAIDSTPATISVNTTGNLVLLNGCATGADYTDRIGRKIRMKSVQFRGFFQPADDSTVTNYVRMMIVYDRQTNGNPPTVTEILQSASSLSSLNLNNRERFTVVADKEYVIGRVINTATQAVSYGLNVHKCKGYRRLNLETQYGGSTNAVASIATGSLYMLTIGNIASGGGTDAVLDITLRVRFTEM